MGFFFQELVNGLTVGALYSLVALGFSMVYGVLKLLNFAHGDLYMVGAFIGYFVHPVVRRAAAALTIPVPLLLVIMFVLAALLTGGLGVAIERFAYRPLRNAPRIAPLITAIGISFFLENAALLLFGGAVPGLQHPGLHLVLLRDPDRLGQHRRRADHGHRPRPGPDGRAARCW